ncbi:MAG TPA: beta-ketoacyl synthase N-terminal-like domain-containing protein, partial [Actinoplanes sp.]|nr:beta-ketoacyl synthase N-terminal-like domain-containing protein [Actinoplanes sp.]
MPEVYLVGGVRTPQGKYGGALAGVRPDDLAALVVREAVRRGGIPDDAVDEVVLGAANQAGEDNRNVARMAVLLAGLPDATPGYTVNRLCASGLTAIVSAANTIRAGEADVVVAGGVESMTRAPWVMAKPGTPWARPGEVVDTSLGWRFTNPRFAAMDEAAGTGRVGAAGEVAGTGRVGAAGEAAGTGRFGAADDAAGTGPEVRRITLSMGETAEEIATLDGISRDDSDAFALRSHRRAIAAIDAGRLDAEITPVGDAGVDEIPRRSTTLDKLGALRPVFRTGGVVTAGSSSPLSDGAAAVVVASEEAVDRYGLTPRARIV